MPYQLEKGPYFSVTESAFEDSRVASTRSSDAKESRSQRYATLESVSLDTSR